MLTFETFFTFVLSFIFSLAGYQYLITLQPGSIFYVRSEKSTSAARLLGGLPLAAAVCIFLFYNVSDHQAAVTLIPAIIITAYGFFDDKYEMRARLKLIFQIMGVGLVSLFSASMYSDSIALTVPVMFIFGMALVNGSNLLDGLDTMTIKTATSTLLGFFAVSYITKNSFALNLSVVAIASLNAFYFYNKEPAKLYLGEIGGSFIGLTFLVLGFSNFITLNKTHSPIGSLAYVLLLCSLPLNELGISFVRRLWSRRSPFRGDRLHLHHILRSRFHFSASQTSTVIAAGNLVILAITLPIAENVSPTLGLFSNVFLSLGLYIWICKDTWAASKACEEEQNPFRHFINKPVILVNTKDLDESAVIICFNEELKEKKFAA